MFVCIFEAQERIQYMCPLTGKPAEEVRYNENPWYKGIPFEVLDVNGPIIALHTNGVVNPMPPIVFFDARTTKFLETTKEFYSLYMFLMKRAQQPPQPPFPFPQPPVPPPAEPPPKDGATKPKE